jgi:hypothetical protein
VQATGRRPGWSWKWFVPALAPALVGAAFFALGHPGRAAVLWVIAGVVLVLVFAGVPVDEYIGRFAVVVAHAVGVVATGAVGVILVVAGAIARLLRSDPLTPRARKGVGWQRAADGRASLRLATAPFGVERVGGTDTTAGSGAAAIGRGALLAVGALTALLAVDLGIGLAWERLTPEGTSVAVVRDVVNFSGTTQTFADPRAQLPAMADYPWADEYLREVQTTPSSYWPFTESRPRDFRGEYVTIEGWERRSHTPAQLSPDAPVVWMFGGSTTWGLGQRDEHTIASYLSRLAEEQGTPIRVVNYGQRGWTHFQEMILFEQLLAAGEPPELAVFYDGANEVNAQAQSAKGVPTHTFVDQYAELISGGVAPEFIPAPPPRPSAAKVAWDEYLQHSAIRKAVRRVTAFIDTPAGASESVRTQAGAEDDPLSETYQKPIEDAQRAVDVYERGRGFTQYLAAEYDVDTVFFWQPVRAGEADLWAAANVSPPTIDVSDALDSHQEVYIDGGHTNEEGARIVAERLWQELRPLVAEFYGR